MVPGLRAKSDLRKEVLPHQCLAVLVDGFEGSVPVDLMKCDELKRYLVGRVVFVGHGYAEPVASLGEV